MTATKKAYTRDEVAALYGVSLDTVRRAINKGELKAKRQSRDDDGKGQGKYLVSESSAADWFDGLPDA